MRKKIIATIEARMTSSRLPGKVLMPLHQKPALERMIERVRGSRYIDDIVLATTVNSDDDLIVELCKDISCNYYLGSENDVLSRVLGAVKSVNGDIIVELTGDCPLVDHRHIDHLLDIFFSENLDYVSNTIERTFPDGFDVQVFSREALEKVDQLTNDPIDRIHVSYYIYTHPEIFKIKNWNAEGEMYNPGLGLTIDEKEDYELINKIFTSLYPENPDFSSLDIMHFLKQNPELVDINSHIKRKAPQEG